MPISAATGFNIKELKSKIWDHIERSKSFLRNFFRTEESKLPKVSAISEKEPAVNNFRIRRGENGIFIVEGPAVDYYGRKIILKEKQDLYLLEQLEKGGLSSKLRNMGAKDGDLVLVNGREYEYKE